MEYEVKDETTGTSFMCKEDESLLAGMRRTGQGPVKHGCFGGGCGACKVHILSGEYEIFKKMSRYHVSQEDEQNGTVLACCVMPRGNITLKKA